MFVGLKTSFGAQDSPGQTWALMFGLAGYTLLLAAPACLLVRVGGVWEDVRAVLIMQSGWAEGVPPWLGWAYPPALAAVMGVYGWRFKHVPSMAIVPVVLTGEAVLFFGKGYRWLLGHVMGLNFIVLGLVLLALAQAISAAKAGLFSRERRTGKEQAVEPWI